MKSALSYLTDRDATILVIKSNYIEIKVELQLILAILHQPAAPQYLPHLVIIQLMQTVIYGILEIALLQLNMNLHTFIRIQAPICHFNQLQITTDVQTH